MPILAELRTFASPEERRVALAAQHRAILERSRAAIARSLRLLEDGVAFLPSPGKAPSPPAHRVREPEQAETRLVDLSAAYAEALQMLPELWREAERTSRDPSSLALDLTDQDGRLLLTVPFADLHARQMRH